MPQDTTDRSMDENSIVDIDADWLVVLVEGELTKSCLIAPIYFLVRSLRMMT